MWADRGQWDDTPSEVERESIPQAAPPLATLERWIVPRGRREELGVPRGHLAWQAPGGKGEPGCPGQARWAAVATGPRRPRLWSAVPAVISVKPIAD